MLSWKLRHELVCGGCEILCMHKHDVGALYYCTLEVCNEIIHFCHYTVIIAQNTCGILNINETIRVQNTQLQNVILQTTQYNMQPY